MGQSIFITAGMISLVYIIIKYLEMKFIVKEPKPVKIMIRDTIIVYLSAIVGLYIISEFISTDGVIKSVTNVFTDTPSF